MVAADFALLSFAVLSTIGFQPVRGEGRYARYRQRIANRDESETITYATLQPGDSVTVLTNTPTPPPGGPPSRPTTTGPGNSPPITVLPIDLGHSASSQEGEGGSPSSDLSSSISSSLPSPDPQPSSSQEQSPSLTFNTLQLDTASVTSTATAAPTVKPPGLPVRPGKSATAGGAGPVILPTIQLGGGGNPTDNTFVSKLSETPYNTLQTLSDSVTSTASLIPTIKPTRPGQSPGTKDGTPTSADLGTDGGSTNVAVSDSPTSTIGVKATPSNSDGSNSISYIDPEQYGAGGSLTTDSNAPSRTANPTRPSVIPNPTSRVGPPPADTYAPRPPAPPIVSESSTDVVTDPTSVASDALSYLPPGAGVAGPISSSKPFPSSKPGRPTKSLTPVTLTTIDLGHTAPFPDDGGPTPTTNFPVITPTGPFANGTSNSTWIDLSTVLPPLTQWSFTMSESLTTDERGSTGTICMPSDAVKPTTTYEIVYTSTVTWYGNPEDYTPPYPSLTTPAPCITPKDPLRFTASYCSATRTASGADTSKYATCVTSTVALTYAPAAPGFQAGPTITFVTTDKNPTVVYSTIETPDYGVSQPATRQQDHTSAEPSPDPRVNTPEYQSQAPTGSGNQPPGNSGAGSGGNGNGNGPASGLSGNGNGNGNGNGGNPGPATLDGAAGNGGGGNGNTNNPGLGGAPPNNNPGHAPAAPTPITVGVQPTAVVVNGNTITDNPSSPTQTLTIGGEAVTINPTAVVVAGQTVTRTPIVTTGGVFIPTPTSTQIQGVPVVVSSSIAIIGGTSFTLGPTPITTTVSGQPVTLGPSGVVVASTTIAVTSSPSATQVVVEGGELITAIGPSVVVIHGTTLTYGPDRPATTTTVDDDTITIGPSGVVLHGTTIGGPNARSSQTQYEIVGGATITQIGPSVIVINNTTYTVGPGTGRTTTVIGGETITIGPSGVAAGTHTMTFPFGPSTTTTITPKATGVVATASPTASKDAAIGVRPPGGWLALGCFAVSVWGWVV